MFLRSCLFAFCCLSACMRSAFAQRALTDIPVPDTAAELAAMAVAEGYEVNLFAADPLISKPLQMNFDPQGRLWVASSSVYPQIRPGEVPNDTVTVLEDRDGDGVAETSTLFADGLHMPTAVLPGDGGAYVANSTELLHLSDTDGDGRADLRRTVLSGFGTEDSHHIIHTFRWGPDARLYFNQSIYIHSHVETPHGVRRLNAGGIWRLRPGTLELDVFSRGLVNPWGHAFEPWGRSLATDGAGGEGIYHCFPGSAYQTAADTPRILHGMSSGCPKYCGLEQISGRHLPEDAQGLFLTNDFRANRVCQYRLADEGSGFSSEKLPDLIHSTRVSFRPIDIKMGPDGAIYIADWYNPIIQHGEVDFRDDRRDRVHGRIWRVTAKGRPLVPRTDFTKLSTAALLEKLQTPEGHAQAMARRVLFERGGREVREALRTWTAGLQPAAADFHLLQLEALRLWQGLDDGTAADVQLPLLNALLAAPDRRARAAAARVVVDWADRLEQPVELLAASVDDPEPCVRLEGVRALSALGGKRAAELVLHAVDHPRDDALDYAVWLAARELEEAWVPAVLDGSFADDGKLSRILFAVQAAETTAPIPLLVARLQAGSVSEADQPALLDNVAKLGSPAHLRLAFDLATDSKLPPEQAAVLLEKMLEAHQFRKVQPTGDLSAVAELAASQNKALAVAAIQAAAAWQVTSAVETLEKLAGSPEQRLARRRACITALGHLSGDAAHSALKALARRPELGEAIVGAACAALVPRNAAEAADLTIDWLATAPGEDTQRQVFAAFLSTKQGADTLASALEAGGRSLPAAVAKTGLQEVSASGREEPALSRALERFAAQAGVPLDGPHGMGPEEVAAFAELVMQQGDATRGEAIYARESMRCVSCHRIDRKGGKVGPNLTAIGASSPLDYIIESLIAPAKKVKEGYNTLLVVTEDGQVVTGVPVSRSLSELVLRDATDKEVRVAIADIAEEAPGTSLMPMGLIDGLSREELADLVRYLAQLGR